MSTQQELDLEARLADMERQLAEMAAKVNPLYSGGMDRYIHSGYLQFDGIPIRWDTKGMQVKADGSSQKAVRFLNTLATDPSTTFPQSYLQGYAYAPGAFVEIAATAEASSSNISNVQTYAPVTGSVYSRLVALAPDVSPLPLIVAGVIVADSGDDAGEGGFFHIDQGPLLFRYKTADPTTILQDGMVWYNHTDEKLRARINGVTVDLGGGGLKTSGGGYYLIPAGPSIGTSVSSSASANTYGSWTEMRAASGNALYIVGIDVKPADDSSLDYIQIDIGTGGAGSETSVGEAKTIARLHTIGSQWGTYKIELPYPIPVAASTRIACRTADDVASALSHALTLHVIDQADVVSI